MLPIGKKVTLGFFNTQTGIESVVAGTIVDQSVGKADGANGPIGQIYTIVSLETARPENGGLEYLGFRHQLVDSWAIAPRKELVEALDSFTSVEDLVDEAYRQRQTAHIRMIRERAATRETVEPGVEAASF